jgi:hypothetical protein
MSRTLAQALYLDSEFGVPLEVPRAGSALEHPLVFDATARELLQMAAVGKVRILEQRCRRDGDRNLIERLCFARVR